MRMKEGFPPLPKKTKDIELILTGMKIAVNGRKVVYISLPITTGKRFLDWHANFESNLGISDCAYLREHKRHVVSPNRENVQKIMKGLEKKVGRDIISPTLLRDLPGWTQDDYRTLWARVLKEYVNMVVFAEGWEYSNGCAYEFLVATQMGIRRVNEHLRPLSLDQGIRKISKAIQDMQRCDIAAEFLKRVRQRLIFLLRTK
jgi:hypothetical protein